MAENTGHHFEDILSITKPVLGDDDEYIYTISPHYIKGTLTTRPGK
ncbi:MAG: hypothetical protein R2744_02835 [Bacteroidales bacterium]